MAIVEPAEYATILGTVRHWPPDARRGLVNDVLNTLAVERPALSPRGFSADEVVGLLRTIPFNIYGSSPLRRRYVE